MTGEGPEKCCSSGAEIYNALLLVRLLDKCPELVSLWREVSQ